MSADTSLGIVRGLLTLALFAAFICLWIWAWSKQRRADFEAAAHLPLEDEPRAFQRDEHR